MFWLILKSSVFAKLVIIYGFNTEMEQQKTYKERERYFICRRHA